MRETRVFVFVERLLEGEEYRVLSDERGGAIQTGHNLKRREDNINRVRHTVNPAGVSVCACPRQVRGKSEKKITAQEGVAQGWMCPITAFERRFSALSEPPFARPHPVVKQQPAAAGVFFLLRHRSYVPLYCTRLYHNILHHPVHVFYNVSRALFHPFLLKFKDVM